MPTLSFRAQAKESLPGPGGLPRGIAAMPHTVRNAEDDKQNLRNRTPGRGVLGFRSDFKYNSWLVPSDAVLECGAKNVRHPALCTTSLDRTFF